LQENTVFPVTEYYGAQTSTTTKKIKTSFDEKREERKLRRSSYTVGEVDGERGKVHRENRLQ
jgi:hypothetical protein